MVRDMTQGKPIKVITLFAIPLFIGSIFQQIYNMVDSIVVGNFVGAEALASVGTCAGAFNLIIALVSGLTSGTSVVLAQYFGAKNEEMVKKTFIAASIVNIGVGVILTFLGVVLTRPLLLLLGTPDNILEEANTYLMIMCIGILANCLYNGMSAVLRALGDSITPLMVLVMASLLNIGLDLLFVIQFGLGVAGVAIATVLAQLISAVACIIYVFWRMPSLRFRLSKLEFEKKIAYDIIRIGVPAALSSSGVSISVMFMQRAINEYGSSVIAAYTIANRAEQIGMCLAFSIGMAVGTFCGQNIGAQDFERVKKGMHVGYIISISYAVIIGGLMVIFAQPMAQIFNSDPEVIRIAVGCMRVTLLFSPVLGLVFVYQNFLRSAGDIAPTVWMSCTEIVARSVLAFLFSWWWGYYGIWWATPIGWVASMLIGIVRYRTNKWKTKLVAYRS